MLKTLSYLNLIIAVCYFLQYLQNSGPLIVFGMLAVVVYNWIVLRNLERGQYGWDGLQWIFALVTVLFALYTGYSSILLLLSAVSYQYYPVDTVLLIGSGLIFSLCLLFHVFLSRTENSVKKYD